MKFGINGEELILCESYCIVRNREYGEWCMDRFLVMEAVYGRILEWKRNVDGVDRS